MALENLSTQQEFENLLEKHYRELYIFLWRMLQNKEDAEDCLQDTFLKAYKAYPRLKNHDYLRAWLYKIASNNANTRLKNSHKEQMRSSPITKDISTNGNEISVEVENMILLKEVKIAVDNLPSKQRIALVLKKFQHFKYPEIAEVLNISEDSARANVYQALKKLRAEFKNRINDHD